MNIYSSEKRNELAKKEFYIYGLITSVIGLWPLLDQNFYRKLQVLFAAIQIMFITITPIMQFFMGCADTEEYLDCFLMFVLGTLVLSKIYFHHIDRYYLRYILNSACKDWKLVTDENGMRQMIDCSQICNKMATIFYTCGIVSLISLFVKIAIFDEPSVEIITDSLNNTIRQYGYKFILPGSCIFNGISQYLYYVLLVNQCLQMAILSSTNLGSDTMFAAITGHIYVQFDILMERMKKFANNEDDVDVNSEELGTIVKRHQTLIFLAETLEKVYSKIIFVQMFVTVSVLSVGGVSLIISINNKNMANFMKSLSIMIFMLFESYLYTYPADNLANRAELMLRAIYSSHWYKMPVHVNKNLVFMMMRINLPPYLTCGKFFYMTRESYMDVIKTSASYLSVLRVMIQ